MSLQRINFWLSLYQAFGFSIILGVGFFQMGDGGMGGIILFFASILFSPFLLISFSSLISLSSGGKNLDFFIGIATALIVIPSWISILTFELGGLFITILGSVIGVTVWLLNETNKKLFVFHIFGSILLSSIVVFIIWQAGNSSSIY
jgi:hypothetical protein